MSACELSDLETFLVAFAENADGSGGSFDLQITIAPPDEQDVRLGMDTYCITVDAGPTCYGGIERCTFHGSIVSFELTPQAADALGIAKEIAFDITDAVCDRGEIEAGLRRVFERARERVKFVSMA